jgi:hypothetical protein
VVQVTFAAPTILWGYIFGCSEMSQEDWVGADVKESIQGNILMTVFLMGRDNYRGSAVNFPG